MKYFLLTFFTLTLSITISGQNNVQEKYKEAEIKLKNNNTLEAYTIFKDLKTITDKQDTLYKYIVWYAVTTTSALENQFRMKEDYKQSLQFGLEAYNLIRENKSSFNQLFAAKEQWMCKNIIISYFGLDQIEEAEKFKEKLYNGYQNKSLPEGIDEHFNFDFFKLNDLNIWGYEWYPELPKDRFLSSFTKIVYYVYSTKSDGTDKKQLYRFHVLMFHGEEEFDYILERQFEKANTTISGSYYQYRYNKDIDYLKLRKDIIEILTNEIEPSTKRSSPRR